MTIFTSGITIEGDISITGVLPNPIIFNTAGTHYFAVPAGVSTLNVVVVGGGGGGAGASYVFVPPSSQRKYNGGGGQGGFVSTDTFSVLPGQLYQINIGSGGVGGAAGYDQGYTGGYGGNGISSNITFNGTQLISAAGGYGGGQPNNDFQSPGGYNGIQYLGFYGGQNYTNDYGTYPLAPSAADTTSASVTVSGGGAGGGGPGPYNTYPGSGGAGAFSVWATPVSGSPGYAGLVQISW